MKKTINKETLFELLEEEGAKTLSEYATKHDCHMNTCLVPFDGKFWMVNFESSYNNGVQGDEFELQEAEQYEVTVKTWRVVK